MTKWSKSPNKNLLCRYPGGAGMASQNAGSTKVFWYNRAPTTRDYDNWFIGTIWIDQSTYTATTDPEVYILAAKNNNIAKWVRFYGGAGVLETITGDTGLAVPPNAADTVFLSSGITGLSFDGNPATSTITLNASGGGALLQSLRGDTSTQVYPAGGGYIDLVGSAGYLTVTEDALNNKLTFALDDGIVKTVGGNLGAVSGTSNTINIMGSGGILVSQTASDTLTIMPSEGESFLLGLSAGGVDVYPDYNSLIYLYGEGGITLSGDSDDHSITISGGGSGGFPWTMVTALTQDMEVNNGYTSNNAALVTLTLPTVVTYGDIIRVSGFGAGGWTIAQQAGQQIHQSGTATTVGLLGSLSSTNQYDAVELLYLGETGGGVPTPLSVAKIVGSRLHTLILTTTGEVYAAGTNTWGQLGLGPVAESLTFQQCLGAGAAGVTDIFCTDRASYILKSGALYATGYNSWGQLGVGDTTSRDVFTACINQGTAGVDSVFPMTEFVVVLKSGALYGSGRNTLGHYGTGNTTSYHELTAAVGAGTSGISDVVVALYSTYIIKSGELYATGGNAFGQLVVGDYTDRTSFTHCSGAGASGVTACVVTNLYSVNTLVGDALYGGGLSDFGTQGLGTKMVCNTSLIPCIGAGASGFTHLANSTNGAWPLTFFHNYALRGDALYYTGTGSWPVPNPAMEFTAHTGAMSSGVTAGNFYGVYGSQMILKGGAVYGIGAGQSFGAGVTGSVTTPTIALGAGGAGVTAVFPIGNDGCPGTFILSGGSLYASGDNDYGSLGLGDKITRNQYTAVPAFVGPTPGNVYHFEVLSSEGVLAFV